MSIIRTKKDRGYFAVSNEPFNDNRLSWEARGMMAYLLSKPDGWIVRTGDLIKQTSASKYKTQRIINELKEAGYIRRFREQNDAGRLVWVTEVYERCDLNPDWNKRSDDLISRPSEKPLIEKPTIGKLGHIKKTDPKESTKENESSGFHFPAALDSLEFAQTWADWIEHREQKGVKPYTRTAIKALLAEWAPKGQARTIAAIRHSIARNWATIYEPEESSNGAGPKAVAIDDQYGGFSL